MNLCLLVRRRAFARLGRSWDRLLETILASSPCLAARLDGAVPCRDRPLAIGVVPFGYLGRKASGVWCVGDQAAVVPSFAGSGISFALHSAYLAASAYLSGETAEAYAGRLARDAQPLVRYGTWLSRLLVTVPAQPALGALAQRFPSLLTWAAAASRLPEPVLPGDSEHLQKELIDGLAPAASPRFAAGGLRR